jgi:hypothetical protein
MMFSSRHLCELIDIGLPRRQQRRQDTSTALGDLIAMGAGDFAQDSVRSQQDQLARDGRGSTSFFYRVGWARMKQTPQVPIAQSGQGKFSAANGFQESPVFGRPRIQTPIAVALDRARPANRRGFFSQGRFARDAGQGFQVAAIGRLADLAAPPQVSHSPSQPLPAQRLFGLTLGRPIHLKVFWMHNGGFHPQDAALFVT